jgi:hypothetical protein
MKIDINEIAVKSRNQDCGQTLKVIQHDRVKFWSWGANAFKNYKNRVLRFTVSGHIHKGHVYIAVNGSDLYDVYLTTSHGNIKKTLNDIYFEDLQDRLDVEIERIAEYKD